MNRVFLQNISLMGSIVHDSLGFKIQRLEVFSDRGCARQEKIPGFLGFTQTAGPFRTLLWDFYRSKCFAGNWNGEFSGQPRGALALPKRDVNKHLGLSAAFFFSRIFLV